MDFRIISESVAILKRDAYFPWLTYCELRVGNGWACGYYWSPFTEAKCAFCGRMESATKLNQSREHVGIPLAWYEQNLKDYAERYVNDLRTIGILARIVRHKDGWLVIS